MKNLISTQWTVDQLVQYFAEGRIAVPEIQRDVVWDADQVKELVDSISRGYPCGSIILWEPRLRDAKLIRDMIRPERLKLFEGRLPTYFLLDGQQRLTSLVSLILPRETLREKLPEVDEEDMPAMLFGNLKKFPREIEASADGSSYKFPWVLLNRLFDTELFGDSKFGSLSKEQRHQLDTFAQGIRNYQFPVQIIQDRDYETVGEIFSRVNSSGTSLTGAEIHLAKIVPRWQGITPEFRIFLEDLREKDYELDLTFLLRGIAAVECGVPNIGKLADKVAAKVVEKRHLDRTWRCVKQATKAIIRILQQELYLDKTKFFTSKNVLVPLVYYAAKDNSASLCKKDVMRFFLFSQLSEHYSSASETKLRRDLRTLTEPSTVRQGLSDLADNVEREARQYYRGLKIRPDDVAGSASKNVMVLLMYIIFQREGAGNFGLGRTPSLNDIHSTKTQLHHIFPFNFMMTDKSALKFRDENEYGSAEYREMVNDIANLTFLSQSKNAEIGDEEPWVYLRNHTTKVSRRAHCIPEDESLWRPQRYADFICERRRLIAARINALLKTLL